MAFWWLMLPSLALAWLVWRLPEPACGGHSRITDGAERIRDERETGSGKRVTSKSTDASQPPGPAAADRQDQVGRTIRHAGVEPRQELVRRTDPVTRPVWWAARHVLRIRTNVVLILASTLGYFFFAGLRSFAIIFATGH